MANPSMLNKAKVRAGLKTQELDQVPLVGDFFKWARGSSHPLYRQAYWHEVRNVVNEYDEDTDLPIAEPNPDSTLTGEIIQRFKRELVVVAAGRENLFSLKHEKDGKIAVTAAIGDVMIAGVLQEEDPHRLVTDLGYDSDNKLVTAALRVGRTAFPVGLVVFLEENKTVIRPDEMFIYAQRVPINQLSESSPPFTRFF